MPNYSQDHQSFGRSQQDESHSSGNYRGAENYGSSGSGRGYRDQDQNNWQRRSQHENQSGRGGNDPYGTQEDFGENRYASSSYRNRGQHRGEPWPRNEDRENYSSIQEDYSFGDRPDRYEDNSQSFANRAGRQNEGYGNYAQDQNQRRTFSDVGYGQQAYSQPDYGRQSGQSGYGQSGQSRGQSAYNSGYNQQGSGQASGGWGNQGSWGNQSDNRSFGRGQNSPFNQSSPYLGQSTNTGGFSQAGHGVQNWQERDGAQQGAFGIQGHRGKGPRGYSRSDERVKEDVCERLSEHHYIDASNINVEVRDGVVTLDGSIGDRWQKYQAEELTDSISGVKDVQNRLTVNRQNQQSESQTGAQAGAFQPSGATSQASSGNAQSGSSSEKNKTTASSSNQTTGKSNS